MKKILEILVLFFLFVLISCSSSKKLYIENPIIKGLENPYNYNNTIFSPKKEYVFDYVIIKNKDSLKYKIINDSLFEYIQQNELSENNVEFLSIKTLKNKGPIFSDHSNYSQTEIVLSHLNQKQKALTKELTGVIENNENLWLHPFRLNAFQILQFSPFPYIKQNESKPYYWNLKIGTHWDELKNIEWKGNLNLKCKYENKDEEDLTTPLGTFKIIKTVSSCKSKIGINYLTTYYNKDLGFIKLEYKLINNEKIIMTLKSIN